jgi:Ca-activated chloride channel family protein
MIRFLQPWWLLALLPVIAVAAVYVWRQFRRRQYAMKFTNVDLLRTLAPRGLGWRRHAAAGAFLRWAARWRARRWTRRSRWNAPR